MNVYTYPEDGEMTCYELMKLLGTGEYDPMPLSDKKGKQANPYIREDYFTAKGWRFKVVSTQKASGGKSGNSRLDMIYEFDRTTESNSMSINKTVVLVCDPIFSNAPHYSVRELSQHQRQNLFGHSLIHVRRYLEQTNDIVSMKALHELLGRKGMKEAFCWPLCAMVRSKFAKEPIQCSILVKSI